MNKRKFLLILLSLLILALIPLTVWLVKQRQEIRKRATENGNLSISNSTIANNDKLEIFVLVPEGTNAGYIDGAITYDPNIWDRVDQSRTGPVGANANRVGFYFPNFDNLGTVSFKLGAKNRASPFTGQIYQVTLIPKTSATGQTNITLSGTYVPITSSPSSSALTGVISVSVIAPPHIDSIVPTSTPINGSITITGTGFGTQKGGVFAYPFDSNGSYPDPGYGYSYVDCHTYPSSCTEWTDTRIVINPINAMLVSGTYAGWDIHIKVSPYNTQVYSNAVNVHINTPGSPSPSPTPSLTATPTLSPTPSPTETPTITPTPPAGYTFDLSPRGGHVDIISSQLPRFTLSVYGSPQFYGKAFQVSFKYETNAFLYSTQGVVNPAIFETNANSTTGWFLFRTRSGETFTPPTPTTPSALIGTITLQFKTGVTSGTVWFDRAATYITGLPSASLSLPPGYLCYTSNGGCNITPTPTLTATPTPTPTPTLTLTPTITTTPACPNGNLGNINCDSQGLINETDLSLLLAAWAPSGPVTTPTPPHRKADLNDDNKVDEADLSILLTNWQASP